MQACPQATAHAPPRRYGTGNAPTCSCRFCGAAFQSKNALFRHLRESDACSAAAAAEDPRAPAAIAERKQHVATYLVGYGAGKGADAEAALTSLCSASSVTRATAVAARSVRSISVG